MYASTFIFTTRQFDAEFHQLDDRIAAAARAIDGYAGEECWHRPDGGQTCNVYYWRTLEALQQLIDHPAHREAKAQYERWLGGYQVVVSQVLRAYGDGALPHLLARP